MEQNEITENRMIMKTRSNQKQIHLNLFVVTCKVVVMFCCSSAADDVVSSVAVVCAGGILWYVTLPTSQ